MKSFAQLVSRDPRRALDALLSLRQGRARFKEAVADGAGLDPVTAPVDDSVVAAVRQARREGRKVYLATAADRRIAETFAASIGPFDGVFASENGNNLKGESKAARLTAAFGLRGFDYVGDAKDDIPVWRAARIPFVAGGPARLVAALVGERPDAVVMSRRDRSAWASLGALRAHQWAKNALIILPAIAGHSLASRRSPHCSSRSRASALGLRAYTWLTTCSICSTTGPTPKNVAALSPPALSPSITVWPCWAPRPWLPSRSPCCCPGRSLPS